MLKMGFLAENAKQEWKALPREEIMHRFDSGRAISFTDARMHTAITGTSGSGKTSQNIVPILDSTIAHIPTVLILDPKGTLGELVLGIADKYGRSRDLITFGTIASATPLNIIEGMSSSRFFDFCLEIFRNFTDGGKSHNMDFHASSCAIARDVFYLVNQIAEMARAQQKDSLSIVRDSSCTLPLILDMFDDFKEATKIFQEYLKIAKMTPRNRRFVKRIKNSLFHILNQVKDDSEIDNDHEQQVAYHSGGICRALGAFLDESGVIEKFCYPGAPGLDLSRVEGKIILLSFGPGAGGAAASLCRLMLESFYAWVYNQGINGKSKMIIGDEYQEFADLSNRKLADPGFFALAREFQCGGVFAFQSYSALLAKNGQAGLDGLLSNFSNKIFLRTEDPLTREAAISLGGPDLIDLQQQAFCVSYDSRERKYHYGLETMNDAYRLFCSIPKIKPEPCIGEENDHGVEDIFKTIKWLTSEKKRQYQKKLTVAQNTLRSGHNNYSEKEDNEPEEANGKINRQGNYYRKPGEFEEHVPFWDKDAPARQADESPATKKEFAQDDLRLLYSDFFKDEAKILVPVGFAPFISKVFDLMENIGMELKLSGMAFSHRGDFSAYGSPAENVAFLNRFLACAKRICVRCGTDIEPNVFNLCAKCSSSISKHVLNPHKAKK